MCKIETCNRKVSARGWCHRHYENWRKYDNPIPVRDLSLIEFVHHRGFIQVNDCLEYKGKRNPDGYGLARGQRVHRIMWEEANGTISDGLIVRHTCDNPSCSRLDHLSLGTKADNQKDMVARRRHWYHTATHCRKGHEYASNKQQPPGDRKCWECFVTWCERNERKIPELNKEK